MTSISRSHVCIDLSLDMSGRLIEIGLSSCCKIFTSVTGRTKCPVDPESAISSLFFIFVSDVEYAVSIVVGVWLLMIVIFHCRHCLLLWILVQIYCRYFVGWGTTILHHSFLDFVYLFYPFLIQLPLTAIRAIIDVVAAVSMYLVGPSPSLLFLIVVLGSIHYQPLTHREDSCVALSLMRLLCYVRTIN